MFFAANDLFENGQPMNEFVCREEDFWKEKIKEYVSFPNPINTLLPHIGSIYRLHMVMQAK